MNMRAGELRDIPGIARVQVETWRTTYAGIVPAAYLAGLTLEDRERLWRANFRKPAGPILVAEEGGEVAGFAYGGPNRGTEREFAGELYAIYVLDRFQGRGLGRALLGAFAGALGAPSLIVWVFEGNRARGFYEAMGAKRLGAKKIMIGGAFLDEISYGWADAAALSR
jgi:GNAT superfamily N-acetyltransferase